VSSPARSNVESRETKRRVVSSFLDICEEKIVTVFEVTG
jgi:hypothetical protein